MEFNGTAPVNEIGSLQVPWNPMEFHGTARVSEIGVLLVPWKSMELRVDYGVLGGDTGTMEEVLSDLAGSTSKISCHNDKSRKLQLILPLFTDPAWLCLTTERQFDTKTFHSITYCKVIDRQHAF